MSGAAGYRFGLLAPAAAAGAEAVNAPWLGARTLGVEVTDAVLAARCGLGNIDPQHGFGGGLGACAIEAALHWPAPPAGARLVTLRPDADALGAMAILGLRAGGARLSDDLLERVSLIGRCDSFAQGGWRAWTAARGPLPRPAGPDDVVLFPAAYRALAAAMGDGRQPLEARVALIEAWLLSGEIDAPALTAALAYARRLAAAWNSGALTLEVGRDRRIAVVRWAEPGGLQLGYRLAPVAIAQGGAKAGGDVPRPVAIAQFEAGHVDLGQVKAALGAREAGWGGSATLIASPQGVGTLLPLATIEAIVAAALTSA